MRWCLSHVVLLLSVALHACGGGDASGIAEVPALSETSKPAAAPAPTPPVSATRLYQMVLGGANALALDFEAGEWQLEGTPAASSGRFAAADEDFQFLPGNSVGSSGTNTLRFATLDNAVMGLFPSETPRPFLAVRDLATTIEDVQGTYMLQAQLTFPPERFSGTRNVLTVVEIAGRKLRMDGDEAELAVDGPVFSATFQDGDVFTFRVARLGAERVLIARPEKLSYTRWTGTGLELAALQHTAQVQLFSSEGIGEASISPERYTVRMLGADGKQRTWDLPAPKPGPVTSPVPSYLLGETSDGRPHFLRVMATRQIALAWYEEPDTNPYIGIMPAFYLDKPARAVGRVR